MVTQKLAGKINECQALEAGTIGKAVKGLLLTCGLLLAACRVPFPSSGGGQIVPMETVFDLDEHRQYLEPGTNNIKGQAFLVQRGGGVVTCAGNAVALLPATKFFDEYLYLVRRGLTPQTRWKEGTTRHGFCDAQGNFSFTNLPDGKWHILTEVRWEVPLGGSVSSREGGLLEETVTLPQTDPNHQIILTGKNLIAR